MDEKENTVSSPDEKTSSSLTPLLEAVKTISGTNTLNLPQIASLRLKPTKSTDSLTHHPLLNNDDEESDVISTWSSQRSRRSSSNSSSSSLQPRLSTHPVPGGSVGGLLLAKLREMNAGFSDIVRMLIAKKATLLLPASPVMPFENVDRAYLEDHVAFSQSSEDGTKVITLNGVRGFIQQNVFKAVGLMPTEQVDIEDLKNRKTMFDGFSKPADFSYDYPSIKVLYNSSEILLHGYPIQTIVIESPIRTKEIAERIATRTEMERKVEGSDLPESLLEEIHNFTREFMKNLPKNEDSSIDQIQGIFDHVRYEIEYQMESNGELTEANENSINETMNIVEKYVCTALYNNPKWSNDNADDEALGSKIAALNLLELGLSNLGVDVKPQQQERIDLAVQAAGAELQNLEQKKAPHEKLDSLVRCHRIVVEALEKKTRQSLPSVNYKTTAPSQNSCVASPTDISPASIPLPPSPTSPTSPKPPNIHITPKLPISPTFPMSPTLPTSPTDEKYGSSDPNADAIFPLLIFIVVKSNPKKLISNLRFMSRYRVRNLLCGESSYCLTNIMAVVQFLESTEYLTLGLSSDKVLSLEQKTRKVGQEIAVVADNSLKVITGVMDSSVKMFGRLIGYNENISNPSSIVEKSKENSVLPKTDTDHSDQNFVKELAEINTTKNNIIHTEENEEASSSNVNEETKSFTGRLLPFNVLPRFSNDRNIDIDEEENKRRKVNKSVNKISPPVQKFLDCSVDEFRVNDVPELLADYKRLANAIRDLGLFSS